VCPCSKAISEYGAHNQRGIATVIVRTNGNTTVDVEDLIALAEMSASSPVYSLVKRTDEKQLTEAAFENAVFVEDVVRNMAQKLDEIDGLDGYRVEVENFESIHNHSAYAVIER
jgi:GTP cyclohydrolase I